MGRKLEKLWGRGKEENIVGKGERKKRKFVGKEGKEKYVGMGSCRYLKNVKENKTKLDVFNTSQFYKKHQVYHCKH